MRIKKNLEKIIVGSVIGFFLVTGCSSQRDAYVSQITQRIIRKPVPIDRIEKVEAIVDVEFTGVGDNFYGTILVPKSNKLKLKNNGG